MNRSIPPLDLIWLLIESANAPAHVGAVLLFERPPKARADFVARIVARYRKSTPLPPFNRVPELSTRDVPRWRTATDVDLGYHVQHLVLPEGSTDDALVRLVEDLHEPVLDRNRPAFRVWLIEGLPGGRFAMYLKVHHSLVDGISAVQRINASLAPSPRARLRSPFFAVEVAQPKAPVSAAAVREVAALNGKLWRQGVAVKDVSFSLIGKSLRRLFSREDGGSQPFIASHLPTNRPVRTARSFAMLDLPLDAMRAAGNAFGGTINDVATTIVDAGLNRYLAEHGSAAREPLVVMCPVSLREAGDTSAQTKATVIFVPLGKPRLAVAERMQAVRAAMRAGKSDVQSLSRPAATLYALSLFGIGTISEMANLGRVTGHLANFVLSNVPGATAPGYLEGARMTGLFPISALGAGIGVNVTLVSNAGTMGFGIVANGMELPDIGRLAAHVREAFAELQAAAGALARAGAASSAPAAAPNRVLAKGKAGAATPSARRASNRQRAA